MGRRAAGEVDWERVRKLYELGQLSIRDIARECNIQPSSVTRRAEKENWLRDQSDEVRKRAKAMVLSNGKATVATQEDIDAAAASAASVLTTHRRDAAHWSALVRMLAGQLGEVASNRDRFEAVIEEVTKDDKSPQRYNQLMRAVSLASHAGVVKDLTAALKNLVYIERQAFNLDAADTGGTIEDWLAKHCADLG
ncbi:MAG TPA: hypothetical protein PKV98_04515 [Burkholderiaceae bacterium]|nr:hypothetical protein [Burkholderiaceae bacterium]